MKLAGGCLCSVLAKFPEASQLRERRVQVESSSAVMAIASLAANWLLSGACPWPQMAFLTIHLDPGLDHLRSPATCPLPRSLQGWGA